MSDLSTRLEGLSRKERAALLGLLRKKKETTAAAPAPSREEGQAMPLSFAQQRLWFLDRLAPGNPVYNVPGSLRLTGRLDIPALTAALTEILRRHAALRTRFEIRGDGPVQIVEPAGPLSLPVIDLSALPEPVRIPEEQRVVREEGRGRFDLTRPPLMRARLVRLAPDTHLLVYVFHHIASDAWSFDVAVREVGALYPAYLEGRPSPLPEPTHQYTDYAWEQLQTLQGETLVREVQFWRQRLDGAPLLDLPTDRPRPAIPSFRGGELDFDLPAELDSGLRLLARRERATPFMALLAPISALFSRIVGTDDVVVGTVVSGRDRRELVDLIGFFINTLVLRVDLTGEPDGGELLTRSRQVTLDAFAHQALPFEKLVDELGLPRDPFRPPLLRALFQLLPATQPSSQLEELKLERYHLSGETAKFDLVINAYDFSDALQLEWRYDADLFEASTIARWAGAFETLLGGWLQEPARHVYDLPLLTEVQRLQLLSLAPEAFHRADRGRRALSGLFEEQVDRTPDAPAVSLDGESLTYRELDERANRLARWLVEAGIVPGERVALCLDRSPEMIVTLLGVLKAGAAYVPLDPSSPRERLVFALEDSGASLVLATGASAQALPEGSARAFLLDREAEAIARRSSARLGLDLDPELPAYVIYTSGSTGRPKGVVVPHGNVSRLFAATESWFGFGPDDVWTLFHSYAFDFSVWEIWGALLYGGRLVVVPYWESREPEAFFRLLREERVTVLNQTPSAFRQILWAERGEGLALRWVIFGGEALDPSMLEPWFARHGDERPRLVNMYGITETTVHVTFRPLSREDVSRPASLIGQPIPDLTLHVLDRGLQLQPIGIPGEICVGGEGLAHGYLDRADLTAERFVPDPYGPAGSRLYRSGDLARRRPDGELEYLGRIDHQVKIRGFRIELGEIEAALSEHPAVREAVVLARADGAAGDRRLVAYVTTGREGAAAPSLDELRESMAGRLPDYMIPTALVVLDRLPLTSNGKVDRRALPSPDAAPTSASGHAYIPPRDLLETELAALFRQVLHLPAERGIGILDDFFALGGSSISGAVLVNRIQEKLGDIVHVVVIFDHPTVASLAAYVREQHPSAAARVWGVRTRSGEAGEAVEAPAGAAEMAEMLRLIVQGRPELEVQTEDEPLNPPAVFILSPPRSGSTLLRIMLGAHPRLFAPPELELLSFRTLAGRHAAFQGRDSFWLEGVTRAVMEARQCDAAEAERIVDEGRREGWTTRRFYRELQGWIGDRLLVDKTPSYALDPEVLRRGEQWFAGARYIHLMRHPQATNRSFEEAKLDQIFFRRPHRFSRRQLAELIWTVSHRHILEFLAGVPAERQTVVRFEDLVRDPDRVLGGICGALGLPYDPAMADPYRAGRMTDGVRPESRMLGDVKFLSYGKVDAASAERWRERGEAPLGKPAQEIAARLGYGAAASRGAWEDGGTAPTSFAQERLWLLEQLLQGTPTYNIPGGIRLHGRLDFSVLSRAISEIVRRHAALRTVFATEAGQPVQRVQPYRPVPMPVVDLSALPEDARDAELRHRAAQEADRPFNLEVGPLFRIALLVLGPSEHAVLYAMHHIVSDGWSMGVFSGEIVALYESFAAGRPSPLPELPIQYPDFAVRQRGKLGEERLARSLEWWKEKLAGVEPLELPTDHARPPVKSGRGASTLVVYPRQLVSGLSALARNERATLYMGLLAAFQTYLHRITRQDDIAVGSPVANRTEQDVEGLIGFFVNTLVLRTDSGGDPTFREMLARVRRTALDSFLHQEAPFERVVEAVQPERHLSRTPLFQVLFALQNNPGGVIELPGVTLEAVDAPTTTAKFDLSLLAAEFSNGIGARMEYDLDLYEEASAARMLRHLGNLIRGIVAAPDTRLSELPLLDPAEREEILFAWNRTEVPFPQDVPIHRLVEEQADRQPGAVALAADGLELTYADLDAAANRLARRLRRRGAGPEVPVIVLAQRSPVLVTALLAVLKSGSFFVPLDPSHPRERLAALATAVGARLVVTEEPFLDLLPEGTEAICLDRDGEAIAAEAAVRIDTGATGANLMYVMFTSGSTGEPKGVAVTHRNVARLVRGTGFADLRSDETFLLLAPVSFDASTLEIWGALANGGRLAIFPAGTPALDDLSSFLERQGVTQLWLTAGLFHQMVEERPDGFAPLRRLLAGGDVLSPSHARRALEARPGLVLVNGYGPTEGTTFTTCHVMTSPDQVGDTVAIGRPIANTRVYVLEASLEPAPPGVWGELFAAGDGLARGYFGRPDLTAERFVPDPFGNGNGARGTRLYRTGDLARYRPDGVLEFLGRQDRQVKIRGFRIEPAEIEAALTAHPGVREAAVLVRQEAGDKRLVAYVAAPGEEQGETGLDADLKSWLAGRLPEPMIPSAFVVLPRLPLTANGKVDRRELAKIAPERSEAGYVAPRTPVEETLADLFVAVLGEERTGGRIGVHDDFFELGGHSLAATRLVSRIRAALGAELPLRALFEAPTVAGLALLCGSRAGDASAAVSFSDTALVPAPRDPAGEPLSFSQERLWFLDRLTPGTSTNNLPSRARLRGPLDPALLAACFTDVCRRHEVLRTRFTHKAGTPLQVVDPPSPFPLPMVDLTGLPEGVCGLEAERQAGEEADQPFDLERGPLMRAVLLRLGVEEHGLLLNLHHIVTDGWSMGILFRELAVLYQAFAEGRPSPLPELPIQIADVARWQRKRLQGLSLEKQLGYWRERLAGAPQALDLPLDRVRPAVQTFRGESAPWLIPANLSDRLRALARREGASLFMVLLAGFDLLLARQSGQNDVLVGMPIAGRDRSELENLIGLFLNTLVLRVDLSDGASGPLTGRELLARAREAALGAYAHQDIPFEKLLEDLQPERDLSRTPLFQVFLNMLNFPDAGASLPNGLVLEPLGGTGVDSKFDLTIYAAEAEEGISLSLVYNADLFDRGRMEELLRQLQGVLDQLAEAPDAPVDSISLRTAKAWTLLPYPREPLGDDWIGAVHALFAERARLHPERTAVSDVEGSWTYGELAEAAARVAARLRADGLTPGDRVAIWAYRGAPVAWAVLGALWAGGAFVMLDPAYPPARLAETLELAAPGYWLELASAGAPAAEVEETLGRMTAAGTLRGRLVLPGGGPEGAASLLASLPEPVEPAAVGPDDLAYVAFTSGSTGTPKGIQGRHGPLSHFLPFQRERFGLSDQDRYSLLSGLSHDPLQRDIFTPLCLGASLSAPTAEEIATPGRLAAWMARERITNAHLTPAMGQILTETGSGPAPSIPTLRWVLLVGDVLTRLDVERLRRIAPNVTCVNLYGSTETQRSVAHHVVEEREITDERAPQVLPLGKGMRDVQLLLVGREDREGLPRLAGVGEVGEIWVRSRHLARGYMGDPVLTADRFRVNPFTGDPGDRVYRTGDLGRYRPDGEVTFAGRADLQVKIRGFRIELGEIEAALGRLPGVRESVVLAREISRQPGERSLVAYVVGEEGLDPAPLREALRSRLPAYMVPGDFVLLERLPMTPNGKVDRRALAAVAPERKTAGMVEPRTPVEEALAGLFVEVLGSERTGGRVGVHDNFFELGGHSLLATRLVAAIRETLAVELPLRLLFERPTVEALAASVVEAGGSGSVSAEPVDRVTRIERKAGEVNRFPVSFSQLREWILDRLEPGNPAYNIPSNLRIGGPLSVPVLTEALNGLVRRHEVFRTAFVAGDEEPLQAVFPQIRLTVPVVDISALPEKAREDELQRRVRQQAGTGFDLAEAPLLRASIVRLGSEDHAFLLTVHHIISDGWSMGILNQELAALYEACAAGAPSPLPELPIQYADYAVWLRRRLDGEALEQQVSYWKQQLTGAPPLLELPTDRPRPPVRSSRGARLPFLIPRPLVARMEELARSNGATVFMVLLAGYQAVLARWSGQDDVTVGTYSGNRPRKELEGLIGFFINTLVLRTDLSGDPSFTELIGRVRETTLGSYVNRDIPFEKVLEVLQLPRDPSRTPLFQAHLVFQNFPPVRADLSTGVRLSSMSVGSEKSDYDLALWLGEAPDGISGAIEYSTDLFDEATIARFGGHLVSLLEAAVSEPGRNVWSLPLTGREERARQLEAWSRGPAVPAGTEVLHRLVEEQAVRTPDAVALEAGTVRLTYAELVSRSRDLADRLRRAGAGPGAIVGLSAERSPDLIVSMLAVLQSGAAYLPIDLAYPQDRRDYMLEDSGAMVFADLVTANPVMDPGQRDAASSESLAESPSYVIYTSGSTGRPKGVVVPHRAITSFVRGAREGYGVGPGHRVLQFASISFDTSAEEIWPALASGATLVLRPEDMAASIPHFLRELERLGITVLDLPTAFWHEMVAGMEAEGLSLPRGLRVVILGGEEALADRLALWRQRVGSTVRLVNTYGPTETTIVATRRELSNLAPGGTVPIGRPIAGARTYLLDRFFEPVPPGVRAELWIGGAGVAHGYLGRPDLTAERFVPDPFGGEPGARLYRTGDLAVLRPDGDLVFAGRADRQLKVRGYRIEPGEIEAALRLHPSLRDAVVDARGPGDAKRLVAWIVPHEGVEVPGASDLRAFLRDRLPEPLLPAAFQPLAALPLTPSGKVDRRALPEPTEARPDNATFAEPQSNLERTIAGVYRELLRVSRVGLHDNFFDLGGHSLLIVRAHQKLKEALGREIPVLDLFRFPTVAGLARHLGGEETGNLQKVQSLAEQQRAAQQRQKQAMAARLRGKPGGPVRK